MDKSNLKLDEKEYSYFLSNILEIEESESKECILKLKNSVSANVFNKFICFIEFISNESNLLNEYKRQKKFQNLVRYD